MLKSFFRKRFWIGILFLSLSLLPLFVSFSGEKGFLLAVFHILYDIGIVLVCDYIIERISNKSFLISLLKSPKNILLFALAANISGVILDSLANYFGGMWYYPYWSNSLYLSLFSIGFTIYFSSIIFSYLAFKTLLDKWTKGKHVVTKSFHFEKYLYTSLLVLGTFFLGIVAFRILYTTQFFTEYKFVINQFKDPYLNLYDMFIAFFGVWFVFEYLSFKRHDNNLIKDIIHGYWNPLIAILLSAFTLAIYMEIQNLPIGLWVYSNIPFMDVTIIGLPILLFVGWPLHYIAFLSVYRFFGRPLSVEVWKGDVVG